MKGVLIQISFVPTNIRVLVNYNAHLLRIFKQVIHTKRSFTVVEVSLI